MSDQRHLEAVPPPDDESTAQPHDDDAERQVLGAMLRGDRWAIDAVTNTITGADYYQEKHEHIHDACVHLYARGTTPDVIAVTAHLRDTKNLTRAGGPAYLHTVHQGLITSANADFHADNVLALATRRRGIAALDAARARMLTPSDDNAQALVDHLRTTIDAIPLRPDGVDETNNAPGQNIDDFLDGEDEGYDWLIPGVLEKQDRLIITAGEGHGKSTLLRQIAVQSAAGVHPFTLDTMTPIRVLVVDLENSKRQNRRKYRQLRIAASHNLNPDNLWIECRVQGLDLTDPADEAWLDRLIAARRPDLLVTGPIYKLAGGDPNDEKESKPAALALDRLRAKYDLTLLLEAHTKKAEGTNPKHRAKDPFGWSGWRRWPEFGMHLSEDGELTHWRGPRDERDFPSQLNRGGRWPFTPATTLADQRWVTIRDTIRAAGRKLTQREISDATGIRVATVNELLGLHSAELARLYYEFQADSE